MIMMKPIRIKFILFCGLLLFALHSCFNKYTEEYNSLNINELPLPCSVKCNNAVSDTANVLPLEIANQLFKYINRFEGEQFYILMKNPETWAVEYRLPSLSPDFEIWIVSNTGESSVKLLATISIAETPAVIQALPIAYNIAIEKTNYIESEFWTADIDNSYNIVVTKNYERLYSIVEEGAENKSNFFTKKDNYIIELNGKITYQKPKIFDIDYNAIIQFADTSIVGGLSEDWVQNTIEIQEQIEALGILFITATAGFDKVEIKNYYGETVDIVDISSFISKHDIGYLALKKGEKPLFIPYASADKCLQKAEGYFNLEIITKNEEE
jgi:hypothetical protein